MNDNPNIDVVSSNKPIIAIDIDEVLAHFIPKLADFHNENYGTSLTVEHFNCYEFHKVWGGSLEETSSKVMSFFDSPYISTVSGSYDALKLLKQDFSLHIVTSRQHIVEDLTRQWIYKNYPDIFDEIHFGNHYTKNGISRSKSDICKDINALLLVDDSLIYAKNCASSGIPVILFGHYPWNRPNDIDKLMFTHSNGKCLIHEVNTWDQVVGKVYQLINQNIINIDNSVTSESTDTFNSNQKSHNHIRIAAIQMCSTNNKEINFQSIERLISRAVAEGGAQFICLPECSIFMGEKSSDILEIAEDINPTIPDSYIYKFCKLANKYNVYISVGGFPERRSDVIDKVSNSHIIIDDKGEIIYPIYRKIHLFDNPLTGLQESKTTEPGDELVCINTSFGRLGLSICYDLRFPELYKKLCAPVTNNTDKIGGAEIVLVPSAFTVPTGSVHWELLLRTRAVENQVYIVAAAQSGKHNEKRVSYGHTMIIDPWGNILDEITHEGEGICYGTFHREYFNKIRDNMPVWSHRRHDLY
uniref:CN hydrolase domain-containing protein n=1 Tax=Chromulina nebulosa TaxID=96789 RepID=A0A7S0XC39_9STRA